MKQGFVVAAALAAGAWLAAAGTDARGASVPPQPSVEITRSAGQPVSLFSTPAGGGNAFAQAFAFGGAIVDATLEIVLWPDAPGFGDPIAGFPAQDIWLEGMAGTLVPCGGGTCPDQDTDAEGRTRWAQPLRTGGYAETGTFGPVWILVNGDAIAGGALDLRLNSADLNGDGFVNLGDGGLFTQDLYLGYAYRSDFVWDGVINVSDAGLMAQALGAHCP